MHTNVIECCKLQVAIDDDKWKNWVKLKNAAWNSSGEWKGVAHSRLWENKKKQTWPYRCTSNWRSRLLFSRALDHYVRVLVAVCIAYISLAATFCSLLSAIFNLSTHSFSKRGIAQFGIYFFHLYTNKKKNHRLAVSKCNYDLICHFLLQ